MKTNFLLVCAAVVTTLVIAACGGSGSGSNDTTTTTTTAAGGTTTTTLPAGGANPQVTMVTTKGTIVVELDPAKAPLTVNNSLTYGRGHADRGDSCNGSDTVIGDVFSHFHDTDSVVILTT